MTVAEAPRAVLTGEPDPPDVAVLRALSGACGLRLERFRSLHVARCVDRALRRTGAADPVALARLIATDPELRDRFRRAVAVSTTGMFRDPEQFELLRSLVRERDPGGGPLRVWSAGASDGSELCSVALVLEAEGLLDAAHLLGSDLLPENVARAREQVGVRLSAAQAAGVRFEQRDVVASAPSGAWDVVLCRNVLIHLSPEARAAVVGHLVGGLAPHGLLLLGRSERIARPADHGLADAGLHAYRRAA